MFRFTGQKNAVKRISSSRLETDGFNERRVPYVHVSHSKIMFKTQAKKIVRTLNLVNMADVCTTLLLHDIVFR